MTLTGTKKELKILLNNYSDFLNGMMMLENLDNIEEESSYKRKEAAYNKHLQRLQDHLLKTALQSEAKPQQKFESEPVKTKAPCVQWNQLRN